MHPTIRSRNGRESRASVWTPPTKARASNRILPNAPRRKSAEELAGRAVSYHGMLYSLQKNSVLHLSLGGAAVHRCDKRPVFSAGFSRRGLALRSGTIFAHSAHPLCGYRLTRRSPHPVSIALNPLNSHV